MSDVMDSFHAAFPMDKATDYSGLTMRQYAAIHLRVPESGAEWLDDMIRKAKRDEFAAKAMQAIIASPSRFSLDGRALENPGDEELALASYVMADAMLAAAGRSAEG